LPQAGPGSVRVPIPAVSSVPAARWPALPLL
jgi:hypothetical protein